MPEPDVGRHSLALRFAVGVHGKVGGDRFAERLRVDASCASKSGSDGGDEISGALRCDARAPAKREGPRCCGRGDVHAPVNELSSPAQRAHVRSKSQYKVEQNGW